MGKRLAGTLLAVVLLISFGAAYGEEYPVDVSGMKAAVLCSQDGQSIIEYNSAERLEVGGLGRLALLLAALVVLLAGVTFAIRKELALLDVLTLGKAQAINLGVDYDRGIRRLLLGVTLYIAVATAMVGPISFLGLIVANLSRQLLKTYRHSQLILGSALFGMIVLVGGQLIVEHVYSYSVPVSVFITVGGGLYFLYLLLTRKKV